MSFDGISGSGLQNTNSLSGSGLSNPKKPLAKAQAPLEPVAPRDLLIAGHNNFEQNLLEEETYSPLGSKRPLADPDVPLDYTTTALWDLDGDGNYTEKMTFSEAVGYALLRCTKMAELDPANSAHYREVFDQVWLWAFTNLQRRNVQKIYIWRSNTDLDLHWMREKGVDADFNNYLSADQQDHLFCWRWIRDIGNHFSAWRGAGVIYDAVGRDEYDRNGIADATDASQDIAYTLIQADRLWGSSGGGEDDYRDYLTQARFILNDIFDKEVFYQDPQMLFDWESDVTFNERVSSYVGNGATIDYAPQASTGESGTRSLNVVFDNPFTPGPGTVGYCGLVLKVNPSCPEGEGIDLQSLAGSGGIEIDSQVTDGLEPGESYVAYCEIQDAENVVASHSFIIRPDDHFDTAHLPFADFENIEDIDLRNVKYFMIKFNQRTAGDVEVKFDNIRLFGGTGDEAAIKPYLATGDGTRADKEINASYYRPAYYSTFASVDPSHPWLDLRESAYEVYAQAGNTQVKGYHDLYYLTGDRSLPPDFIRLDIRNRYIDSNSFNGNDYMSGWDACRVYWQVAWDFRLNHHAPSRTEIRDYLIGSTGPYAFLDDQWTATSGNIHAGYQLDGTILPIDECDIEDKDLISLNYPSFATDAMYLLPFMVASEDARVNTLMNRLTDPEAAYEHYFLTYDASGPLPTAYWTQYDPITHDITEPGINEYYKNSITWFALSMYQEITTGISEPRVEARPSRFTLGQNFPNPFNSATTINYNLAEPGEIRLAVYNVNGRLVKVLDKGRRPAGAYQTTWQADDLPSGTYFLNLTVNGRAQSKKITLAK